MLTLAIVVALPRAGVYASPPAYVPPVSVHVFGQEVIFPAQGPIIADDHTLVPIRAVFEALDFAVEWNADLQQVLLRRGAVEVVISIGSTVFYINNQAHHLLLPAQIIGNSTMLPIRAVLEGIGYAVGWHAPTRTVLVYRSDGYDGLGLPDHIHRGFVIPDRRLTDAEREQWSAEYWADSGPSPFELEVIEIINNIRTEHELDEVTVNVSLMLAARFYVQTLVDLERPLGHNEGPYAVHESYHGASVQIAEAFGAPMRWNSGNGASGIFYAADLVDLWMNSPAHRALILSPEHLFVGMGSMYGGPMGAFHYLLLSDFSTGR